MQRIIKKNNKRNEQNRTCNCNKLRLYFYFVFQLNKQRNAYEYADTQPAVLWVMKLAAGSYWIILDLTMVTISIRDSRHHLILLSLSSIIKTLSYTIKKILHKLVETHDTVLFLFINELLIFWFIKLVGNRNP